MNPRGETGLGRCTEHAIRVMLQLIDPKFGLDTTFEVIVALQVLRFLRTPSRKSHLEPSEKAASLRKSDPPAVMFSVSLRVTSIHTIRLP